MIAYLPYAVFLTIVAALFLYFLLRIVRRHRPADPQRWRFEVIGPARCPRCTWLVTRRDLNRLHDHLGQWRPGTFRTACPSCGHHLTVTVREMP